MIDQKEKDIKISRYAWRLLCWILQQEASKEIPGKASRRKQEIHNFLQFSEKFLPIE